MDNSNELQQIQKYLETIKDTLQTERYKGKRIAFWVNEKEVETLLTLIKNH